ncbi:MAG TPA: hypothetical protein VE057_12990 [Archangium sp.]|nr:hypothetical protein [Archangium sp.]
MRQRMMVVAAAVLMTACGTGDPVDPGDPSGPGNPSGPDGTPAPTCTTAATFTPHPPDVTMPCGSGTTGELQAAMHLRVGTANVAVPIVTCGKSGTAWQLLADGPDPHAPINDGHAELSICGGQQLGTYTGTGVSFTIQTDSGEPTYASAADTHCTVCINPDGSSGSYSCLRLRKGGTGDAVDVTGSFVCAP